VRRSRPALVTMTFLLAAPAAVGMSAADLVNTIGITRFPATFTGADRVSVADTIQALHTPLATRDHESSPWARHRGSGTVGTVSSLHFGGFSENDFEGIGPVVATA